MNRHRIVAVLAIVAVSVLLPLLFTGCSHEVWPTGPSSITISGNSSVMHGSTQQLSSSASGVTWSSSDTSIATVSSTGLVTGMGSGTATITATSGSVKGTFQMKVTGQAQGTADSTSGANIQVSVPSSPINGTTVNVAAAAVPTGEKINIEVDYAENPPSALPSGAQAASKTLVLTKDVAYDFHVPVTVTMPVDGTALANGDVPIVMAWSETYNKYIPGSLATVDRTNNTITFEANHFTKWVTVYVPTIMAQAQTKSIDTGFRPEVDGFFHPNFGSYEQPGGSSLGMALYSAWYYGNKKATDGHGLYSKYLEGDPAQWQDDKTARELITRAYMASSKVWANIGNSNKARPNVQDTATAIFTALQLTGEPQPLLLKGLTWAHAVLVYQWDASTGNFMIYDSNFPGTAQSLSWEQANGFSSYTRAAAYPGTIQSYALEGLGIAAEGPEFENLYQGAENGWTATKFGTVTVTAPTPDTTKPTLVNVADGNNVQIQGTVTGGVKIPTNIAYYLNGTRLGTATITSGQFTFTITKLPRPTNVLMLVATNDPRDPWNAYGGFGEYTLQILGQNFFVNPGFETGDFTGWTHETHTWQNRTPGSYPSEKSTVISGVDPYDPNLMVQHGTYAARVNNSDTNYHISSVSQQVTVPSGVSTLQFYWAAVLEDPGHPASQQPYVKVLVVDNDATAGTTSMCPDLSKDGVHPPPPAGCLYYQYFYSNDPNYPGWLPFGYDWEVIEWQTATVDVSSAVGHKVTVSVEAADCAQGGHGGYAYFDGDVN